jgi:hypothetical protein
MHALDPDRRRLLLAGGAAALALAATPAAACTLTASPRRRAHSDAAARATIRAFLAAANRGEQASDEEVGPFPYLVTDIGGPAQSVAIREWLSAEGRRDDRPATLHGVAPLAMGGRKAIYLVRVARSRFAQAQDDDCFGSTGEGFFTVEEVWLFRFQDRRLTSIRQLPELERDFDELVADS